jgi:dTDP-glucose 4,6-dehydratase
MKLNGQKVLVTGAGGFIGSHLVERLQLMDCAVSAFVRYNSAASAGHLDRLARKDIAVFRGEITEYDSVREAMRGQAAVFHLAALIGIPYSYVHPSQTFETNALGTLNVLLAARELSTERVVITSTSEVYGSARYAPIDEDHPLQAQSPYSASKIAADKLAESFYRAFGTPVATARPFNTFGPRQSARAVIPTIIAQALRGDQIRLGSTSPTRDLTFVEDTVDGFVRIALHDAAVGEVINLGTGREISIGELARTILRLVGRDLPILTELQRVRPSMSEVERLVADCSKAQKLLGWVPRTSIEEGLLKTIAWIRNWIHLYDEGYQV